MQKNNEEGVQDKVPNKREGENCLLENIFGIEKISFWSTNLLKCTSPFDIHPEIKQLERSQVLFLPNSLKLGEKIE